MNFKKFFLHILCIFLIINFLLPFCFCFGASDVSVAAPVCILMEVNSGKILYEKNAYDKMYPASTTKIMTAILALENRELSHNVHVSSNAVSSVPFGYTNAKLQVDEDLTLEQLLNVLLIPSANDAANAIAEDIGGSIENFANMMNSKAHDIGCKNTNFVNPSRCS